MEQPQIPARYSFILEVKTSAQEEEPTPSTSVKNLLLPSAIYKNM
jgi:hypothetical protein